MTTRLTLDINNPSEFSDLGVELWLDECKFYDQLVGSGKHHVIHDYFGNDQKHSLRIVLKGKVNHHTIIDQQGNILSDALINISNICFNDINIDYIFHRMSNYYHNTNGNDNEITSHKFYGDLGCNGCVELNYFEPYYMWLLETM